MSAVILEALIEIVQKPEWQFIDHIGTPDLGDLAKEIAAYCEKRGFVMIEK